MNKIYSSLARFVFLLFYSSIVLAQEPAATPGAAERVKQLQADLDLLKVQQQALTTQLAMATSKADLSQIKEKETAANEAAIASSRAQVAAQQAAALKSTFPTDKVTPLEGKITADKDYSFPPQILAYAASEQMIAKLASKICSILQSRRTKSSAPTRLVIYQATDSLLLQRAACKQLLSRAKTVNETLSGYEKDFEKGKYRIEHLPPAQEAAVQYVNKARTALAPTVTPTPTPTGGERMFAAGLASADAGITAVNSTLQTIIQLVSLFRTDTTITGVPISLDVDALCAQFGHEFQTSSVGLIIEFPAFLATTDSPLLDALAKMSEERAVVALHTTDIDALISGLNTREQELEEQIKRQFPPTSPPPDEISKLIAIAIRLAKDDQQADVNRLTDLRQRIVSLDQIASALDKSLQTPDDKTGVAPISQLVKTEGLLNKLNEPNTYSVLVKVVAGGGATKIDRNLFTGSKLRQLGGAVFITTLTDQKGAILFTNVSKGFLGYSKLTSTGGTIENDIQPPR